MESARRIAEHMSQQNLRELVDEKGRHVDAGTAKKPCVRGLEIVGTDETLAKTQPDAIVLLGVLVVDRSDLFG